MPGPASTTESSTPVGTRRAVMRTTEPTGATSSALFEEVVEHLLEPARAERTPSDSSTSATRRTPRSAASADHASIRPRDERSHADPLRRRGACLGPGELQQPVHESRQPRDLVERPRHILTCGFRVRIELALEVLEPQPQRRQRRTQLVRCVRHERLLRRDELLEARRRPVEGRRAGCADLGGPSRHRGPGVQVTVAEPRRGLLQLVERLRDLAGEAQADEEHDAEHDRTDTGQHQPAAPDARVDERGRIGDAQRADRCVAVHDRHREVLQVLAEGLRVAGPVRLLAPQRGRELRAAGEVARARTGRDPSRR